MYGQVVREGIDIDKQRGGMGTQDAYGRSGGIGYFVGLKLDNTR